MSSEDLTSLAVRLARTEARQLIGELPARYALAVDSRDIDGWLGLFAEDVDCGRRGTGREALRGFIEPNLRTFYRSIHQICGHVIDFQDEDNATGTVYCRAEHEDGDKWIVMAIVYFDRYVRRANRWYFARREEQHWYAADIAERPAPPFTGWEKAAGHAPVLPGRWPTWTAFWDAGPVAEIRALTGQP